MNNKIKYIPLRYGIILIVYFLVLSLFLFGHAGGADIGFMVLLVICFFVHFAYLMGMIFKAFSSNDLQSGLKIKWRLISLIILVVFTVLFITFHQEYIDFMWWFTHWIKE